MTHLALAYADLPDIDETPPLDSSDRACMEEVRDVLARHKKLDRFGLTLLHQHFPIYEGEVLVETCNKERRELLMRVVSSASRDRSNVVETSWRLSDSSVMAKCETECHKEGDKHWQTHPHKIK